MQILLPAIECRCGKTFCGYHRYSDRHACTFDYRAEDASKKLEKIETEKITKL